MYFTTAIALMLVVHAAVTNGRSIPIAHFPEHPINGLRNCSEFRCSFLCQENYTMNGYSEIEWIDGDWNHPAPTCTETEENAEESLQNPSKPFCSELSKPKFATTRCSNNNALGSTCTYTCNAGFTLSGSTVTTCVQTADEPQWSNSPPFCIPTETEENAEESLQNPSKPVCSKLSKPKFATTRCSNNNALGSTCTYTCNAGFTLSGSTVTTCVQTADEPQWSNSPPFCIPTEPEESFQENRKR